MKIKNLICGISALVITFTSSVVASAENITADSKVILYDEICGYVNITITASEDAYVKILKYTPETSKKGYIVYDSNIDHTLISSSDVMVFPLEYNNYNPVTKRCEGSYDIMVGYHKHKGSIDPNDIVYSKINLTVPDINYCGYETNCNININVIDTELDEPICLENGKNPNMSYDITFSSLKTIQGDADNNGVVDIRDAAFIAKKIAGRKTNELPKSADYNGDNTVDIRDAAAIARYIASRRR